MSRLSKVFYSLNAILIKMLMTLFAVIEINYSKMYIVSQGTPNSQNNLEREQDWRTHTS